MNRRGFLKSILATGVAPWVVTATGVLMPVHAARLSPIEVFERYGVTLPMSRPGAEYIIRNGGASPLMVYPAQSGKSDLGIELLRLRVNTLAPGEIGEFIASPHGWEKRGYRYPQDSAKLEL